MNNLRIQLNSCLVAIILLCLFASGCKKDEVVEATIETTWLLTDISTVALDSLTGVPNLFEVGKKYELLKNGEYVYPNGLKPFSCEEAPRYEISFHSNNYYTVLIDCLGDSTFYAGTWEMKNDSLIENGRENWQIAQLTHDILVTKHTHVFVLNTFRQTLEQTSRYVNVGY